MNNQSAVDQTAVNQSAITDIQALINAGRFKKAFLRAKHLVTVQPGCAEHWLTLSEVQIHPKVPADALPAIRKAVELEPNNSRYLAQLANCLLMAGVFSEAQSIAERVSLQDGLNAFTLDKLGNVLNGCGELNAAHQCFERAVEKAPKDPHFLFNLATLQRAMGKLSEAEKTFTRVIAMRPDESSAYLARSSLRTVTQENNFVDELENCIDKTIQPAAEIRLSYALAKELEDLGEYARSFHYLQRGSKARRKRMDYQVDNDVAAMDDIKSLFTDENYHRINSGCENDEPIFILGLPRTGTTLVERIIDSHSDVFAAGELQNFSIELVKLAQESFAGQVLNRTMLIEKSLELNYDQLGERYINSTRPRTGSKPRFIDKLPLNFLYAGLIHKALPNAKIIHLTRNPMDACYAIYKTLFEQAYPFSYALDDLGKYYVAYRQLMQNWQTLLGDKLLNVSYEGLVNSQEEVSREIIGFCGLEWQDACLHFQKNKTPTATASASQVREGMYKTSVGRWNCYSDELMPLQKIITDAGFDPKAW